jgi:intracellular septation protein A
MLTQYVGEINGGRQCLFSHIFGSQNDCMFSVCQILWKKIGMQWAVHQLFTGFSNTHVSVRREFMCDYIIDFSIHGISSVKQNAFRSNI